MTVVGVVPVVTYVAWKGTELAFLRPSVNVWIVARFLSIVCRMLLILLTTPQPEAAPLSSTNAQAAAASRGDRAVRTGRGVRWLRANMNVLQTDRAVGGAQWRAGTST